MRFKHQTWASPLGHNSKTICLTKNVIITTDELIEFVNDSLSIEDSEKKFLKETADKSFELHRFIFSYWFKIGDFSCAKKLLLTNVWFPFTVELCFIVFSFLKMKYFAISFLAFACVFDGLVANPNDGFIRWTSLDIDFDALKIIIVNFIIF